MRIKIFDQSVVKCYVSLCRRIKRVSSPRRGNRMQIVPMNVGRMILDGLDVSDDDDDEDMMSSSRHDNAEHDRHSPGR